MRLTVLGKYGPFPKPLGGTSSYLLQSGETAILLDAGECSFTRLSSIIAPESLSAIVITHFHHDHTADLGVYSYYFERLYNSGKINKFPLLVCPDDDSAAAKAYRSSPFFDVKTVNDGDAVAIGKATARFFRMNHPVATLGVKISGEGKVFAYTGDTNLSENLVPLAKNCDLLLADGCFTDKDWTDKKPHLSVGKVCDLCLKLGVKGIVSHINPSYDEREIAEEIRSSGADCLIAEEFGIYEI